MIQERRGMLKVWNASLILATGTLAIMGTFLVRSGILSSIHAFGASTLGVPFVALIGVMIAGSACLVASRRADLRSERQLDSLLSREAVFLFQNLALVALCFVIWWGTFFPLISEALTGRRASVGPPWFDPYTVPLALILVLLSGIGPVIAWRRASLVGLIRHLALPLAAGSLSAVAVIAAGAGRPVTALLMFTAGGFALAVVAKELVRGTQVQRALTGGHVVRAFVRLVARNRRRYGGYIVHAGIVVLFVGVAASSSFKHSVDVTLKPGQSARVGGYTFRYVRATAESDSEKLALGAVVDVSRDDKHIATLASDRGYYPSIDPGLGVLGRFFNGEAESRIGLDAGWRRDYWVAISPDLGPLQDAIRKGDAVFGRALSSAESRGAAPDELTWISQARNAAIAGLAERFVSRPWAAQFRFMVSPMVTWIWLGAAIMAAGALVALIPGRRRRPTTASVALRAGPARVESKPVEA
jgi:cytochrome c-type biogenesis protein CcmF